MLSVQDNSTLLHQAVHQDSAIDLVQHVIQRLKAEALLVLMTICSTSQHTPLHESAKGSEAVCEYLVKHLLSIYKDHSSGKPIRLCMGRAFILSNIYPAFISGTWLHFTCTMYYTYYVFYHFVDVEEIFCFRSKMGKTFLHFVAQLRSMSVVQRLIESDISPSLFKQLLVISDNDGETVLHGAAQNFQNADVIQLLLTFIINEANCSLQGNLVISINFILCLWS